MSNKKFNKGITILEALVATAILAMIALFFINSNIMFMKNQQELINFNKRDRLADLIIQDISEYVKFEFNPYGVLTTTNEYTADTEAGTVVSVEMVDYNLDEPKPFPEIGDLFVIEGVNEKFEIIDITDLGGGDYDLNTDITISAELNNIFSTNSRITFISFNNTEFDCFKNPGWIDLFAESPVDDLVCDAPLEGARPEQRQGYDEVANLINHWKDMVIDSGTQVTSAKVTVTDDNLFKVAVGKGTSETVLAKKLELCAYSTEKQIETKAGGEVTFHFPGIGPINTAIMVGNENPIHHYNFGGHTYPSATKLEPKGAYKWNDAGTTEIMPSDCGLISYSPCRKNYNNLNSITVFLYQYDGDTPFEMLPSGCKYNAVNKLTGADWDQCTRSESITIEKGDLSLWFIYSKAEDDHNDVVGHTEEQDNGAGYIGFITSNLKQGARVLIYDDSGESCTSSISIMPSPSTLYYCEGGYDWGNKHDGLVLHLDETDATELDDIELEINIPAWNIDHWRVLKSDPGKNITREDPAVEAIDIADARDGWVEGCLVAEGHVIAATDVEPEIVSAHENKSDECWEKITVNHGVLASTISATATTMDIYVEGDNPENAFNTSPEEGDEDRISGYLRIGNELVSYENYIPQGGSLFRFTEMKRGLRNIAQVSSTPGTASGCKYDRNRWVHYTCGASSLIADAADRIYAVDGDEDYKTALDKYNQKSQIVGNDPSYCPLALGRRHGSVRIQSGAEKPFTGDVRQLTKFKKLHFEHMKQNKFCADDDANEFEDNEYFYNALSEAAVHTGVDDGVITTIVYDANPKNTQISIMTYDEFDIVDGTHTTITIPKKVTLKLTEAITTPVTTSCGDD